MKNGAYDRGQQVGEWYEYYSTGELFGKCSYSYVDHQNTRSLSINHYSSPDACTCYDKAGNILTPK
jgi:antitoxin component YwqK of YwqJK toxin-antitoxin module